MDFLEANKKALARGPRRISSLPSQPRENIDNPLFKT
jgi:hypothetical protein